MGKTTAPAVSRRTLRDYLAGPRGPLPERLEIGKRLLAVMARRHEVGLAHGRLDADAVWLCGVRSFRVELDDDVPVSGVRERRASSDPELDRAADVQALGALLQALLSGDELPPGAASVIAAMADPAPSARFADARVAMNAFARAL
ncbi:MAG: hypothetical protein HYV09_13455 [Deltaproteobacteria bacterium]|nr:hypothetical protein [Deltaproteobacteria bacterium]